MSNNLENRDAYIIFGVDNQYQIVGIENDNNRKDFKYFRHLLKGQNFFAGIYPDVEFITIDVFKHEIDILVVKNSSKTPYYLTKDYSNNKSNKKRTVFAHHIYTRVCDTNTDITGSAAPHEVEYLWKKRFGLGETIFKRYLMLLDDLDEWIINEDIHVAYHRLCPEFQMRWGHFVNGSLPASVFYLDPNGEYANLNLLYHSTRIHQSHVYSFDGGRVMTGGTERFHSPFDNPNLLYYQYHILSDIEGKLFSLFTRDTSGYSSRFTGGKQIMIFNNEEEKNDFDKFCRKHLDDLDIDTLKHKYRNEIKNDQKVSNITVSAIHLAMSIKLYDMWKSQR